MKRIEAEIIISEARNYLLSGNPIWDTKTIDEAFSMAIEALKDRPKGEWEQVPYKRLGHEEVVIDGTSWRCSNCGDARKRNEPDMDFCPNCGADMRGDAK